MCVVSWVGGLNHFRFCWISLNFEVCLSSLHFINFTCLLDYPIVKKSGIFFLLALDCRSSDDVEPCLFAFSLSCCACYHFLLCLLPLVVLVTTSCCACYHFLFLLFTPSCAFYHFLVCFSRTLLAEFLKSFGSIGKSDVWNLSAYDVYDRLWVSGWIQTKFCQIYKSCFVDIYWSFGLTQNPNKLDITDSEFFSFKNSVLMLYFPSCCSFYHFYYAFSLHVLSPHFTPPPFMCNFSSHVPFSSSFGATILDD